MKYMKLSCSALVSYVGWWLRVWSLVWLSLPAFQWLALELQARSLTFSLISKLWWLRVPKVNLWGLSLLIYVHLQNNTQHIVIAQQMLQSSWTSFCWLNRWGLGISAIFYFSKLLITVFFFYVGTLWRARELSLCCFYKAAAANFLRQGFIYPRLAWNLDDDLELLILLSVPPKC